MTTTARPPALDGDDDERFVTSISLSPARSSAHAASRRGDGEPLHESDVMFRDARADGDRGRYESQSCE
jgi:hypothetical protein